MSILQRAKKTTAFAKIGMLGFPGSGKTFTSTLMALGISKMIGNKKVAYFDTETGSDFLLAKLEAEGMEVFQVKSRGFQDLCDTITECEGQGVGVLIIDSITHVWRELCDSYDKKLNRRGRLQFQDWGIIKGEWKRYTDLYVNSRLHIIVCGRAGYEYDYDFNEDGSKDLLKTGTRMKVESEFAFEPSLVIEMERSSEAKDDLADLRGKTDRASKAAKQTFQPKTGSAWIHRAHILKDRTDTMNGKVFDYPKFEDFKPHFDALNLGGEHIGVDVTRTSEGLFDNQGKPDWRKREEERTIVLEEINGVLDANLGSRGDDKIAKCAIKKHFFGTYSETALGAKSIDELKKGLSGIVDLFASDDPKALILDIVKGETAKGKE